MLLIIASLYRKDSNLLGAQMCKTRSRVVGFLNCELIIGKERRIDLPGLTESGLLENTIQRFSLGNNNIQIKLILTTPKPVIISLA